MRYLDFLVANRRFLAFGFAMALFSSFGQTFFIAVFGGETILHGGEVVSLVTSAGYGHTIGKTILMGYPPAELATETVFEIEAFCVRHPARRVDGPLYDPEGLRLRS